MLLERMAGKARGRGSEGFTLIELLIVVVILGILAAIAIPQFSTMKDKSYKTVMKKDLRNLATSQEIYFTGEREYASSLAELEVGADVRVSKDVSMTIRSGGASGWSATADHPRLLGSDDCGYYSGSASVPTDQISGPVGSSPTPDVPFCQD